MDYMYNQKPWQSPDFYSYSNKNNYPFYSFSKNNYVTPTEPTQLLKNNEDEFKYFINVPISTAKSFEGKYFSGTAFDVGFGEATKAWARLYNPPDSGVNLFINVWTVSDIFSTPYRVQIYFNSTPPGIIQESNHFTTTNTTIIPPPQPKTKVQYGVGVKGFPTGGVFAFGYSGLAGSTVGEELQGRQIFPPGGSFTVFLSNPENPTIPASGTVGFGWWEEPIWNNSSWENCEKLRFIYIILENL